MDLAGIAAIIAALAFAALVIVLIISLLKIPKLIAELQNTIQKVNTTIDVVTKDVDGLSIEVEGLLNKTNSLMDDVNGKVSKIDPLFTAVGDLGITVSEINVSAKDTANNLLSGIGRKKPSKTQRLQKNIKSLSKVKDFVSPSKQEKAVVDETVPVTPPKSAIEEELESIRNRKPSSTAGEITINEGVK